MLDTVLAVAAAPALGASGYLFALTLASGHGPAKLPSSPKTRFVMLVPAHDEEGGIAATVRSLRAVDYPADLFRVVVVADNCADRTAERAQEAGAEVWIRHEPLRRGKGFALSYAFERILAEPFADAVVVVDADSEVEPAFLRGLAEVVERGELAAQSASGVSNPHASWRTQLMTLGLTLFNDVRSLGRERLGLSVGLRGNGMCLTRKVLEAHPHRATSLVEDLEYGLALGRAGVRVAFAPHAWVRSAMTGNVGAAAGQRRRWESGRQALARTHRWPLLKEAVVRRDPVLFDLALDLHVPPLATVAALTAGGLAVSAAVCLARRKVGFGAIAWLASGAMLTGYVVRGWRLSGLGRSGLAALAKVPSFVLWKLLLSRRAGARTPPVEWVRTAREEAA